MVTKYNQGRTKEIQTMICVSLIADKAKMNEEIKRQVDLGATLIYSHGETTDIHMMNGGSNDNMWCNNPEETAAFMETVDKPWVAFKVMAAGAIHPWIAFSYAYRHGADFIIAGMFDFQVEADVKTAIETLPKVRNQKRPWRG